MKYFIVKINEFLPYIHQRNTRDICFLLFSVENLLKQYGDSLAEGDFSWLFEDTTQL